MKPLLECPIFRVRVAALGVLLLAASAGLAQMYTVTDLGTLGGASSSANGINASGQVVGAAAISGSSSPSHAFRTAANSPINPATDDLVPPGPCTSDDFDNGRCIFNATANGINKSGTTVGWMGTCCATDVRAFHTAPNGPIRLPDDFIGNDGPQAYGINRSGEVVGFDVFTFHAFRTAANYSSSNPVMHDLGTLAPGGVNSYGAGSTHAYGINDSGQVVGSSDIGNNAPYPGASHAFRTAANRAINPATDDLGTLGGSSSIASHINLFGQAAGMSYTPADTAGHAFRTAPNRPINPATDDLGTLGGSSSYAKGIDDYGQVVGWAYTTGDTAQHAFLYSSGVIRDLNNLIPAGSGCELIGAADINDTGQIAANGNCGGQGHAVLLNPVYKAFVRPPINADGSSVFKARRGVLPVKFRLTQYGVRTCTLPPATIAITRAAGGTLASVNESIYVTPAHSGSNFGIDPTACQYIYHLDARSLGPGAYLVDLSIDGVMVGHAVFALQK